MHDVPLSDRIDYAILAVVFRTPDEEHQGDWHDWEDAIQAILGAEANVRELLSAFKRLWNGGMIHLSKPDDAEPHGTAYSGEDGDDEAFFLTGPFTAIGTPGGGDCWDAITIQWPREDIGAR
ncbi:hypothetical protein [Paludibaculum fermentans]|uniref:hypothetical protein n=1 Tax=Paludibaculum fermentans TaxID=1473598 RepID=UPI003EB966B6